MKGSRDKQGAESNFVLKLGMLVRCYFLCIMTRRLNSRDKWTLQLSAVDFVNDRNRLNRLKMAAFLNIQIA